MSSFDRRVGFGVLLAVGRSIEERIEPDMGGVHALLACTVLLCYALRESARRVFSARKLSRGGTTKEREGCGAEGRRIVW